jgi:NTP pyrophosphatase (non-canonical NTP hydrolase)
MMPETQHTIEAWRFATFGPANRLRLATRANEEMAELLVAIATKDDTKAAEECADVLIVLCGVASALGIDLSAEVDRKMAVNREREWMVREDGTGYHVRTRDAETGQWDPPGGLDRPKRTYRHGKPRR